MPNGQREDLRIPAETSLRRRNGCADAGGEIFATRRLANVIRSSVSAYLHLRRQIRQARHHARNTSAINASLRVAISTLVTSRALLPAWRTWHGQVVAASEHLAASITGDSHQGHCQGTAEAPRRNKFVTTWNYAMLIARGPSNELVKHQKSHLSRHGILATIARFEENHPLRRREVQDALI